MELLTYEDAQGWLEGCTNRRGEPTRPHLLLGNGFSISFAPARFSYGALLQNALRDGLVGRLGEQFFQDLRTQDFELVIKSLEAARRALLLLDERKYAHEITELAQEVGQLKEALAQVLAALHPERPAEISDEAYARVRTFVDRHKNVYTANYDLLLYWSLMQEVGPTGSRSRVSDDGFRDPGYEAEYVTWDYLDPHAQSIFYLHGALHLFRAGSELRKVTWVRTGEALIDQIRASLAAGYFPLYVAEGTSGEKLAQIQTSDYLSRGLRSLAGIGGGLMCYGLSLAENDSHIADAIVRSKAKRLAVSIYGDPNDKRNADTIRSANRLSADRSSMSPANPLLVAFYDASTLHLW
jgi:hypothetical protein